MSLTALRDALDTCVLDAEEFTVTPRGQRLGRAAEVRAVGQGADRSHGAPPEARRDAVVHLLLLREGPEDRPPFHGRDAEQPGPRLLGFLARPRPPLVPVLRLPERQGDERDYRHGEVGPQGGRQRPPAAGDRGPDGRKGHLSLVPGAAAFDVSHLPLGRALRRGPGLVQEPPGGLLGLPERREEGAAHLRQDAEDDRVLQPDVRLRLPLAEVRPGVGAVRRRRREHLGDGDDAQHHGRREQRGRLLRDRHRVPRARPPVVGRSRSRSGAGPTPG